MGSYILWNNCYSQIAELESQLKEQEKIKEQELNKWRQDKDALLGALEGELQSLREKECKALEALDEKEKHIEQLKKEMLEHMSQSAAFTEDDDSEEPDTKKTKRTRKSTRASNARSKRASKSDLSEATAEDSADVSEPASRRSRRGRSTLNTVKEEPIVIEDSPVVKNEPTEHQEQIDEVWPSKVRKILN